MLLPLYQVDAFADRIFTGNPAGVCPLPEWLPDALMQAIAAENNVAETAFFVPRPGGQEFDIRWFTPAVEVALCGHATLASAHVLLQHLHFQGEEIIFHSKSGPLHVTRGLENRLTLNFPSNPPRPLAAHPDGLIDGLRATPLNVLAGVNADLIAVFATEAEVRALRPDFTHLGKVEHRGIIATAPGTGEFDFVSRFFGPRVGINEDPVTGSAHTQLVPYWADKLQKTTLLARQVSARGGTLWCELRGNRVLMSGHALTYLQGEIEIGEG